MLDTFLATLSAMLVMFSCIAVGFVLRKLRIVPENTATVLSKLELNVFLPAQMLVTFINYCTVDSIVAQGDTVLYGLVFAALAVGLAFPVSRLFSKQVDERNIYRYSLFIANMGFLGNAIVPQIMGQEALYSYLLFGLPIQVVLFAWAINWLIPQGRGEGKSLWKRILNPTLVAILGGAVLGLCGVGKVLPGFVDTSLRNLSGCMGPVAMVLTGFIIGGYSVPSLLKNKKVYAVTFLRLFVLPAVSVAVVVLLGADKTVAQLTLIAAGTALGLNTVVVPAAYDGDTHAGAAMAMVSHIGAVISIPLLYALLTYIL